MDSQPDKKAVSVIMITYNHERYIRQAIEGVLMQECTYPFEVVIGEDCSNDNTKAICEDFANRYPHIIKLLPSEKNLGMIPNFIRTWHNCTGKYIAICEGDDYWTDPYKLQKQVDFLEANPEFTFTFHDAMILNQKTGEKHVRIGERKIDEVVDLKSVIIQNNISTCSIVYRNILNYRTLPGWFNNISKGDYGLCVLLAEKGPGKYLPGVMSVYRVHEGGVWSGGGYEFTHNADLKFYNYLFDYFQDKDLKKTIRAKISLTNFNYGVINIRHGRILKGFYLALANLRLQGDRRLRTNPRKIASAIKSWLTYKFKSQDTE